MVNFNDLKDLKPCNQMNVFSKITDRNKVLVIASLGVFFSILCFIFLLDTLLTCYACHTGYFFFQCISSSLLGLGYLIGSSCLMHATSTRKYKFCLPWLYMNYFLIVISVKILVITVYNYARTSELFISGPYAILILVFAIVSGLFVGEIGKYVKQLKSNHGQEMLAEDMPQPQPS